MRVGNPVLLSVQLMTMYQAADCLTRDWSLSYLSAVFICLRGLTYYWGNPMFITVKTKTAIGPYHKLFKYHPVQPSPRRQITHYHARRPRISCKLSRNQYDRS